MIRASGQTALMWIKLVATTFRDELRKMLEQARRKQLSTRSASASGPFHLTAKRTADRHKGIDYDL
jgi:hypothetical protein